MIHSFEKLTGSAIDPAEREDLVKGPDEINLVLAGLEETMVRSYASIRKTWQKEKNIDLRTAAYMLAIDKLAHSYIERGIFP